MLASLEQHRIETVSNLKEITNKFESVRSEMIEKFERISDEMLKSVERHRLEMSDKFESARDEMLKSVEQHRQEAITNLSEMTNALGRGKEEVVSQIELLRQDVNFKFKDVDLCFVEIHAKIDNNQQESSQQIDNVRVDTAKQFEKMRVDTAKMIDNLRKETNDRFDKNETKIAAKQFDNVRSDFKGETVLIRQEIRDGRNLTLGLMLLLIAVLLAGFFGARRKSFRIFAPLVGSHESTNRFTFDRFR